MEPDQERQHGPQQAETDNRGHEKKAFLPGQSAQEGDDGPLVGQAFRSGN